MSQELYYTAPPDSVFEDIKRAATTIWQSYDNTYGYVAEKLASIEDLPNVGDNWMYMVTMFDSINQAKLLAAVNPGTRARIIEAMS